MLKVWLTRAVLRTMHLWESEDGTGKEDGKPLHTHLQQDILHVTLIVPGILLRWT